MKVCRITHRDLDRPRYAVVEGPSVYPLSDAVFPLDKTATSAQGLSLDEVTLLAPVQPSKIVCVGRNYREHAAECLWLAASARNPEDKALLLAIAEGWRVLAERAADMEKAAQRPSHPGNSVEPLEPR